VARRRSFVVVGVLVVAATAMSACAGIDHRPDDDVFGPTPPPRPEAHLLLRLGERRLFVMLDDGLGDPPRVVVSFPVAVGTSRHRTPIGRFAVLEKIADPDWVQFDWTNPSRVLRRIPPGPENPLGSRWIGFASAHGWGIGFHGTPRPELIGQAVSHGCVRMHESDVVWLYDRVRIGTPVIVEP
jgi:lipoprotein-anchoring transpeptidase ErfK/SrfK